jgi:hypothetical protein
MSEPSEKNVYESGTLQTERVGDILVKFNFKIQILAENGQVTLSRRTVYLHQ